MNNNKMELCRFLLASVFGLLSLSTQALTVHSIDFIAEENRSFFNGFEALPDSPSTTTNFSHIEDSIRVEQIVSAAPDQSPQIQTGGFAAGKSEGNNAWYPNGGDHGYTKLSMDDGRDFGEIGLLVHSGGSFGETFVMYELYNDGELIASGDVNFTFQLQYLGFSGSVRNSVSNL